MRILILMLSLCVSQMAAAEPLPDPTRPSIDLNDAGASGVAPAVPDESVSHGLQSIIVSPQYRAAIINGEKVNIGDKTGDSRLVEVRENSVVLQNAQGRRVVELFPKVSVSIRNNEKVPRESAAQGKASGRTNLPEQDAGGNK